MWELYIGNRVLIDINSLIQQGLSSSAATHLNLATHPQLLPLIYISIYFSGQKYWRLHRMLLDISLWALDRSMPTLSRENMMFIALNIKEEITWKSFKKKRKKKKKLLLPQFFKVCMVLVIFSSFCLMTTTRGMWNFRIQILYGLGRVWLMKESLWTKALYLNCVRSFTLTKMMPSPDDVVQYLTLSFLSGIMYIN